MNISQYDHPSDDMMKRAREWLEFALLSPSHEQEFQKRLTEARQAETISFDDAMVLAHAALMMADNGELQAFGPWYRENAVSLFCRGYDTVAVEREARAAAEAGGALQ